MSLLVYCRFAGHYVTKLPLVSPPGGATFNPSVRPAGDAGVLSRPFAGRPTIDHNLESHAFPSARPAGDAGGLSGPFARRPTYYHNGRRGIITGVRIVGDADVLLGFSLLYDTW